MENFKILGSVNKDKYGSKQNNDKKIIDSTAEDEDFCEDENNRVYAKLL